MQGSALHLIRRTIASVAGRHHGRWRHIL
jgi:hypothetical protein